MQVRKVYIMGISGSGKSTLAQSLAMRLNAVHIELDAIHHQPQWSAISDADFIAALEPRLSADSWVVDGNYSQVTDFILERADTVILLDYPRPLVMWRVIIRTLRRGITRQELWNGNRESLRNLLSRNPETNIVLWAWTMHNRRHQRNLEIERVMRAAGRKVHRFEHPRDTRVWLDSI